MIITIRSAVHIVAIIILMIYQDLVCAGLSNPLPSALLIVWPPLILHRCFWLLLLTTMMFLMMRMMFVIIISISSYIISLQ